MAWSKQATILGPPGPAPSGTGLVKTAAGILVNPAALLVNADVADAAAIAESKLALASDAAAGTASRRTLGTGATQAAAGTSGVLTGAEMMWPVATPPTGWLIEDGSSQLIASYPALSALIRTTYGGADAYHFYVPDMRGVVPVGYKSGDANFGTLGGTGGEKTHLLTAAESGLPAHSHTMRFSAAATAFGLADFGSSNGATDLRYTSVIQAVAAAAASAAHPNLQPYRTRNFIIKT